jgi:hypothetical protein
MHESQSGRTPKNCLVVGSSVWKGFFGSIVQTETPVVCTNKDDENVRKMLKELKDSRNNILSEAERKIDNLPKMEVDLRRNVHLGNFDTTDEASEVYQQSEVEKIHV